MTPADVPTKVGFLYPGYAAEDDYPVLGQRLRPPVAVELIHTAFNEDAHTVEALSEMGGLPRLVEGANASSGLAFNQFYGRRQVRVLFLGWKASKGK